MSEKKEQPTATEVAGDIAVTVHNAGRPMVISEQELRQFANRNMLRRPFVNDVVTHLEAVGNTVERQGKAFIVTPPPPEREVLSFSEALEASAEAQETGTRLVTPQISDSIVF
ncbi:MAG: hypothetical protein LBS65_01040 [Desulfovibrio sp.]|nr:hypothetical protein [Desulfovibrio sp.]